jgi:NEDD8-activating enzyme E1 regulatory subunit
MAQSAPKQLSIHLALSALSTLHSKHLAAAQQADFRPSLEELTAVAKSILPQGTELDEDEFNNYIGEA